MSYRILGAAAVTVALFGGVLVFAQDQPAEPGQNPRAQTQPRDANREGAPGTQGRRPAGQAAAAQTVDGQLAGWVALGNHHEVAISQLGERSQNEQVRQFAQKMITEHNQLLEQLAAFTPLAHAQHNGPAARRDGNASAQRGTEAAPDRAPRDAALADDTDRDPNRTPEPNDTRTANVDFLAIKQEIGQRCLESTRRELDSKQETEFDECFMSAQIMCHMEMIDTLAVLEKYATPELRQVLSAGLEAANSHLKEAKGIMETLEQQSVARRPAASPE